MKINTELALPIVKQLMQILNYNVNIMDEKGVIVASGDMKRLDQKHEGAVQVILSRKEIVIDEENSKLLHGTKPGVNLPIEFNEEIVGVVGITGKPSEIYRFAKVIKMTVEVLLQQIFIKNQLQYEQKAMEGFVIDLINPHEFNEKKLKTTADILNIDLQTDRAVFVIYMDKLINNHKNILSDPYQFQKIDERKTKIINIVKNVINERFISTFFEDGYLFLLLPFKEKNNLNEMELAEKLQKNLVHWTKDILIGIGENKRGLLGYRNSYFQAMQTIKFIQAFQHDKKVSHIKDWSLARLIDSIPIEHREDYLDQFYYQYTKLTDEYLHTLKTWLNNNLDMKQTAEKLHIHRNTLLYRLEKISMMIGLNYKKVDDIITLKLLILMIKLDKK